MRQATQTETLLLDFDLTRKATVFSYSIFLLACEGYGASVTLTYPLIKHLLQYLQEVTFIKDKYAR